MYYPYQYNSGNIFVWKSKRKNARWLAYIKVYHLISHGNKGKLTNEEVMNHFISEVDKVFAAAEREFYISVSMVEKRNPDEWFWRSDRQTFKAPTEMLHWLWFNFFCRIYPYNTLGFTEIEMNPSIKYMIEKWKEKGEVA